MAVEPTWASCDVAAPDPDQRQGAAATELPLLADGFSAAAVVVCDARPQKRADGGTDYVAVESRADDIAALLTALRLPDEPRSKLWCTANLLTVAWFALLDERQQWVRPGVPTDGCGKIRIEVLQAVAALKLTDVSKRTIRELESAGAKAAGCSQDYADMVWVETSQTGREWGERGALPFPGDGPVRLCVYDVPASEQRSGKPAGQFERGEILTSGRWASIAAALRTAAAARTCARPAGRFALLQQVDGTGGPIFVELDGCQRIMLTLPTGLPALAQADAALIQLLQ
jgi:hypothetical protein